MLVYESGEEAFHVNIFMPIYNVIFLNHVCLHLLSQSCEYVTFEQLFIHVISITTAMFIIAYVTFIVILMLAIFQSVLLFNCQACNNNIIIFVACTLNG